MGNCMNRWYEASLKRSSTRKYKNSVDKEIFFDLKEFAKEISNSEARIVLLSKPEVLKAPVFMPQISGTKCCAAVITRKNSKYMGGYIGEVFVLECIARGIGTCWLGGSYKKSAAKNYINLEADEILIGVIAFGEVNGELKSNPKGKKEVEDMTGRSNKEYLMLPEWQRKAVECAQLAPSAMNKQEWEFDFDGEGISIYKVSDNLGYFEVDCGIAMLHIELGASQCGIIGEWKFGNESPEFVPVKK